MPNDTGPFQIRDFPIALREEIVREAKAQDQSVSEFMVAICLASRAAGWSRAAVPTANGMSNGVTNNQGIENTDKVVSLVHAACELAAADERLPDYLRSSFNRRLQEQQRALAPSRQRRLPAPDLNAPPQAANPYS
jgi:hypothetical protein